MIYLYDFQRYIYLLSYIYVCMYMYEVHNGHHVMMSIDNSVNLHLFLPILTMFFWNNEIVILSNIFI